MALALGNVRRLKMLRELSLGEPREIIELAHAAGCSYESALKHLAMLARTGLVTRGRGGVYLMHAKNLPVPGERVADFGYFLLRLEDVK